MKHIAYLGIPGSYSYLAAQYAFGTESVRLHGVKRFKDIFLSVENDEADYGIVPVENSLAGSVYDNYDLLYQHPVYVIGEQYLKIDLQLLGTSSKMPRETRIKHISKVVSHYKALEQCDTYLSNHPWMQREIHGDTAGAAKFVSDQKDPFIAAIASRETSTIYNLDIIQENVHDNPFNYTRFLIISREQVRSVEANKCSIIFTVSHTPGSLFQALQKLSEHKMNLDKIESRPIPGKPFEYIFYVDFDWKDRTVEEISTVLKEFAVNTNELKILGYYPAGSIPQHETTR